MGQPANQINIHLTALPKYFHCRSPSSSQRLSVTITQRWFRASNKLKNHLPRPMPLHIASKLSVLFHHFFSFCFFYYFSLPGKEPKPLFLVVHFIIEICFFFWHWRWDSESGFWLWVFSHSACCVVYFKPDSQSKLSKVIWQVLSRASHVGMLLPATASVPVSLKLL